MKLLITGGYGYIGSHIVKCAHNFGHSIDVLDVKTSENDIKEYINNEYIGDIRNKAFLKSIDNDYDAIIHTAALISVPESVQYPDLYYNINVIGTLNILNYIKHKHFIFASTGGAFDAQSPYAKSKIIAETAIKHIAKDYSIFRFFNVAGNNGVFKQICNPSHIIHIAALTACGKRDKMTIFGNDYLTTDGTCIRDYIHVEDLANAICNSIDKPANTDYECIGSARGYSNLEVVKTMQEISNKNFDIIFGDRRDGDPAKLIVEKISSYLQIKHDLKSMCLSAYEMELKLLS